MISPGGRRARRVIIAGVAAFNTGCYTAVPIAASDARMGKRISVDLTDAGTVQMTSQVGPRIRSLTGDVATTTDGELVLALRSVSDVRGIESLWGGEQVTIPRTSIGGVTERRLSRGKTALFAVGMVAGLILAARLVGAIGGGEDRGGEPPVTQ